MIFDIAIYSSLFFLITNIFLLFKWLNAADKLRDNKKLLEIAKSHLAQVKMDNNDLDTSCKEYRNEIKILQSELKSKDHAFDDATAQTIQELTNDLKTHGFMFCRVNPDNVYLRN
jgi:chromosome segregation ATPase